MATHTWLFPFGRPSEPRFPSASGPRRAFLLGAYPSALHIRWEPPEGEGRSVNALAVDNEPEPFWNGADENERIEEWKQDVGWHDQFGRALPAGELNGSTGRSVESSVLKPLGLERSDVCLTDCLDMYHLSDGMAKAIRDVYEPFASRRGLPSSALPEHPGTSRIIRGAQRDRLSRELHEASPEIVITLGEAAYAVMRELLGDAGATKLMPDDNYGSAVETQYADRPVRWIPLVHPGQRKEPWVGVHANWVRMSSRGTPDDLWSAGEES